MQQLEDQEKQIQKHNLLSVMKGFDKMIKPEETKKVLSKSEDDKI